MDKNITKKKEKMIKFLYYLKDQLSQLNIRNPSCSDKIGFGFTDYFSPNQEIEIILDLNSYLNSGNDFNDLLSDYRALFKLHPNIKYEYQRLKQIPKLQKSIINESSKIKKQIDSICISCQQLSDISNSINSDP